MLQEHRTAFARAYLKASIKGNAEASRSMRQLARKSDGQPVCTACGEPWTPDHSRYHGKTYPMSENQGASVKSRLKQTSKDLYRKQSRYLLLAYGFYRGVPYKVIEKTCKTRPTANWIQTYIEEAEQAFDETRRQVARGDIDNWLAPPDTQFELELKPSPKSEPFGPTMSQVRAARAVRTLWESSDTNP